MGGDNCFGAPVILVVGQPLAQRPVAFGSRSTHLGLSRSNADVSPAERARLSKTDSLRLEGTGGMERARISEMGARAASTLSEPQQRTSVQRRSELCGAEDSTRL